MSCFKILLFIHVPDDGYSRYASCAPSEIFIVVLTVPQKYNLHFYNVSHCVVTNNISYDMILMNRILSSLKNLDWYVFPQWLTEGSNFFFSHLYLIILNYLFVICIPLPLFRLLFDLIIIYILLFFIAIQYDIDIEFNKS